MPRGPLYVLRKLYDLDKVDALSSGYVSVGCIIAESFVFQLRRRC